MGRQRGTAWTEARAILRRGSGEFLIVKRHADPEVVWQFPGGHVPGPASPAESLRRLCLAGLGLELGPLVGQAAFVQRFGTHTVTYLHFVGAVADDQATPLGYAELRWVARGQLCEYVLDAPSRHMVERLLAEDG
jgi:8-oxo-dGTP pyrophosphatase MutT (NUDIX family)